MESPLTWCPAGRSRRSIRRCSSHAAPHCWTHCAAPERARDTRASPGRRASADALPIYAQYVTERLAALLDLDSERAAEITRRADPAVLAQIVELLERKLRPGRAAEVAARTRDDGLSMIDLLNAG